MIKDVYWYTLDALVDNHEDFIGHTDKTGIRNELLSEHLLTTKKYLEMIVERKNMEQILDNIFSSFQLKSRKMSNEITVYIRELFCNAVVMHDIGKINPLFQKKLKNPKYLNFSDIDLKNSEHSMLSALIYVDIYESRIEKIEDREVKWFLKYFVYCFACSISRHHSYLFKLSEFLDKLETCKMNFSIISKEIKYNSPTLFERKHTSQILSQFDRCEASWDLDKICFYIINKLLYSLIVTSDFYATYEYYEKKEPQFSLIEDVSYFKNKYSKSSIYKSMLDYKRGKASDISPINVLRTEMFIETEENLLNQLSKNIYFLEAPTGGGKTNTSLNLSLKLLESNPDINKIFYVFPFNTLVEQTAETFEKVFEKGKDFVVVNSITPIILRETDEKGSENEDEDSIPDYEKSLLDRQFLHYPIIITTHINLFNFFFGNSREANFPITQLCNSVVVLDEIQSYRNKIWSEIINFLNSYSKLLNIKIIIMSATLPRLDKLLFHKDEFGVLIKNRNKYFENPVFKDRVKINMDLLKSGKISLLDLVEVIKLELNKNSKRKILIEFIKKKTARHFYNLLKYEKLNGVEIAELTKIIELTGDDNKHTRNTALKEIKALDSVIVVATQVIEAGVDIDMDVGYKDISLVDCEEQFLGRINRSCGKPGCVAYFFNHDDVEDIYREDLRKGSDLCEYIGKAALETKNFEAFYDFCFEKIKQKNSELNKNNMENLIDALRHLDYNAISTRLRLIEQKTFQIYLEYEVVVDGEKVDGKKIWEEYNNLCEDRKVSYSRKKVELSICMEKMNLFTYNLIAYENVSMPLFPVKNDFYYVENGSRFIDEDGKFDRESFEKECKGIFI